FAELLPAGEAGVRLDVRAQRRKIAVVPVHRDVVDLATGARRQEVLQVDIGIGAVAAGGGTAEVHAGPDGERARGARVYLQRGPGRGGRLRGQVRLRLEVRLVEAEQK